MLHPPHTSPDITLSEKVQSGASIESLAARWNNFGYSTQLGNFGDYDYVLAKKNSQIITNSILELLLPSVDQENRIITFEIPTVLDADIELLKSIAETVQETRDNDSPEDFTLNISANGIPLVGILSQGNIWEFNLTATPNEVITLEINLDPSGLAQAVTLNEFRPDAAIEILSNNRFRFTPTDSTPATISIDSLGYSIALGDITIHQTGQESE